MKNYAKVIGLCAVVAVLAMSAGLKEEPRGQASLHELMEGNKRFQMNASTHPHAHDANREKFDAPQVPIATILSCADSRVPPEIIFDQGVGDLFVVRAAGNVADAVAIDSLEFAARSLKTPLIMVLGQSSCGAVSAVLSNKAQEYDIENIAPFIQPAVEKAKNLSGDPLVNAIKTNVHTVIDDLKKSPVLQELIESNKLMILPAYYV